MKALLSITIVSLLFLYGCNPAEEVSTETEAAVDQQTLRVSIGLNDRHPQYNGIVRFKELVEEQTDDFEIELYHSGQIAGDRVAVEMLQLGSLDITIPSTSPLINFTPEYGVFDLPFTIPNSEVADELLDGEFGDRMLDLAETQGMVGLAWWENGFRNLTNDERPIESIDDLRGLKVRTMESDIHLDTWQALGANPTPMSMSEVFSALQQGTVDGQENPYPTIHMENFSEVQGYLTETLHTYTPFIFLMDKAVWDKMNVEQQEIIQTAAVEAGKYNRDINRETAEESLLTLEESMNFNRISDEEYIRFQEAVNPVIEKYSDMIGEEIVEDYLSEIQEIESRLNN